MIRRATIADTTRLVEIIQQVHRLHVTALPDRYRDPTPAEIAVRLSEQLADPAVALLVADHGGLVGYVVVRRVDTPGHTDAPARVTAYVDQLGVHAEAQRVGHGRALMAAAEAQAATWGATAVTLDVQGFNEAAFAFYQAIGYTVATHRMARTIAAGTR